MKQKDLMLVAMVAMFSAVISIVVSNFLFTTPANRKEEVQVVPAISGEFTRPSTEYFNDQSFNPAKRISPKPEDNNNPFKQ